jgi:hypothetical protein
MKVNIARFCQAPDTKHAVSMSSVPAVGHPAPLPGDSRLTGSLQAA